MNWRWKAVLQLAFSTAPRGEHLNYLLQKRLTKSLPSSDSGFLASVSFAKRHATYRQQLGNLEGFSEENGESDDAGLSDRNTVDAASLR